MSTATAHRPRDAARGGRAPLRRAEPRVPAAARAARGVAAGRKHAHGHPPVAVPAHDRARRGSAADRRRRARVPRLPRRVHRRALRPLPPGRSSHAIRAALDDGIVARRVEPVRDGARRGDPRALPFRRARCGSATRAPRRTCSRSRWRASATNRPAVLVFEGGYHGSVFFVRDGGRHADQRAVPVRRRAVQRRRGRRRG